MIKEFILSKSSDYKTKIVTIQEHSVDILNLIRENLKNYEANDKFLSKIKKIDKKQRSNFVFILRSLDFRLWEFPENWRYKGEKGFWGLPERVIDLFKFISLSNKNLTFPLFKKIISPKEKLSLAKLRFKIFKSTLGWLNKKYNGSFDNYFEENKNAYEFCFNLLELEKYRDFYKSLYFLKPNQLLYLEYILANNLFKKYKDELETLTIFADYKIQQIFLNLGLIKLHKKYLTRILKEQPLRKFSTLENELRLTSILLGEMISQQLKIPTYRVDNILWWISHKIKLEIPAPKVKTIFY
jgi:ribosomal protein L10